MEVSGRRPRPQSSVQQGGAVSGKRATQTSTQSGKVGSEEEPPVCKICERNGQKKEAVGYCVECSEHLCDTCYSAHRGSKLSNHHQLLDKSRMPRTPFKVRNLCEAHPDAILEYYCKTRDELLCRHCINLYHKTCQEDDLVSNQCANVESSSEFKALEKKLTHFERKINKHKSDAKSNLSKIDVNRTNARHDISDFKKELHQFVDRLVDDMCEELDDTVAIDTDRIDTVGRECDVISNETHDMINELDVKKQSKEKTQLFIAMKTLNKTNRTLKGKIQWLDTQNKLWKYTFEPEKTFQDMLTSVQKLGTLLVEGEAYVQSPRASGSDVVQPAIKAPSVASGDRVMQRPNSEPERTVASKAGAVASKADAVASEADTVASKAGAVANKAGAVTSKAGAVARSKAGVVASKAGAIAVKSQGDANDCRLTGIELMDTDNIVLVDYNNKSVNMLSLRRKAITHRLKLDDYPHDVTKVSKDTVAVSFCDLRYIQLVSVSSSGFLYTGRQIQLQGEVSGGIQYIGENMIIVGLRGPPTRIQIINMSGTVLKDLSSDSTGRPLFSHSWYIAVNKDASIVYVSDCGMDTVTAMMLDDGRVVFTYRDDQLKGPTGLAVGRDGEIYVCGGSSHNIHMVSSEGKKIKVLLDKTDGMKAPYSVMYNSTDHKLYVGMDSNNTVYMFTLATKL